MVIKLKIKELLSITKGKLIGKIDINTSFKDIKINSKRIVNNDIFIPIIGNNKDGHDFIDEAIKNGCILFLSSKYIEVNFPYILVEDTTKVLSLIAKYILDKYRPLVIGITGSMGKTTTRDMLYNVLKTKYKVQTNIKNYNNNIGIPLSIFKLKKNTQILILELGMNHYNEISYLSKLIKPDISVITNIGSSHIGNFKSKENIFKAKLEILDGMKDKILFINGDDEYLKTIMIDKLYKSGFNKDNDLIGYDLKTNLYKSSFKIDYNSKTYEVCVKMPKHLLNNVLNVINISLYLNVDISSIISSLKKYKTYKNRMNIFKDKNNNTIISDCYNNSFESLIEVLKILQKEKGKKLLIIGSIKELGDQSIEMHKKLKPYIEKIDDKEVFLVGKEIKDIVKSYYFNNYIEVINYLKIKKIKDTLILIKASHSLHFKNITNYFKN